jgi:hypothetical protein
MLEIHNALTPTAQIWLHGVYRVKYTHITIFWCKIVLTLFTLRICETLTLLK